MRDTSHPLRAARCARLKATTSCAGTWGLAAAPKVRCALVPPKPKEDRPGPASKLVRPGIVPMTWDCADRLPQRNPTQDKIWVIFCGGHKQIGEEWEDPWNIRCFHVAKKSLAQLEPCHMTHALFFFRVGTLLKKC